MRRVRSSILLLCCLSAACGAALDDGEASVSSAERPKQGTMLRGGRIETLSLDMASGRTAAGDSLVIVWIAPDTGELSGYWYDENSGWVWIGAQWFTGVTFTGAGGERVQVVAARPDGIGWTYLATLQTQFGEVLLCGDDPDRGFAFAVQGDWLANGHHLPGTGFFTLACPDGVIFKAVSWGYRPGTTFGIEPLEPYFQAATRAARADYCGDGSPHTFNGTEIEIYDAIGLRPYVAPLPDFPFEAAWRGGDNSGAICLSRRRWATLPLGGLCPDRLRDPRAVRGGFFCDDLTIDQLHDRGALIFNNSALNGF